MQNFDEQINRIKIKLAQAKIVDSQFRAFGASGHKYILHEPVSIEIIQQFEKTFSVQLPKCYKAFITQLGNGGIDRTNSAAGPYFGIFPFGEKINFLLYNAEKYLRNECQLFPDMTEEDWNLLTARIASDDPISDDEYEKEIGKIFGGIIPLGSQGCTFIHALIINGDYEGRVVNVDVSMSTPKVVKEKNFLDWYEGWLDAVISGHLLQNKPIWFGY